MQSFRYRAQYYLFITIHAYVTFVLSVCCNLTFLYFQNIKCYVVAMLQLGLWKDRLLAGFLPQHGWKKSLRNVDVICSMCSYAHCQHFILFTRLWNAFLVEASGSHIHALCCLWGKKKKRITSQSESTQLSLGNVLMDKCYSTFLLLSIKPLKRLKASMCRLPSLQAGTCLSVCLHVRGVCRW